VYLVPVHPDGTGLSSLTAGLGEDREPVWSTDGTRIAFKSLVAGRVVYRDYVLAVMNSDGGGRAMLTEPDAGSVLDQTWSPDGRRIAFTRIDKVNTEANVEISAIDADGTGLRNLSNSPSHDSGARWSSR
jgi:Tol biopolymer transport system component